MRYVCLACGYEFDEPMAWTETHGLDHGPYEKWTGCPLCGDGYAEKGSVDCPNKETIDRHKEGIWLRKLTTRT